LSTTGSAIADSLLKDEKTARDTFARLPGNGAAMPAERLEPLVSMWKAGQYTLKVTGECVIH
jgi:hypothetical protein